MLKLDEKKCLYELKQLIQESKDERLYKFFDKEEYLLQFIRGRKYNVESAFETLKYNYKMRHEKYPYIFENLRPSSIRHVYETGMIGILKNRDNEGRVVAFLRYGKWDPKTIPLFEGEIASLLLAKEVGLLLDTQMNGVSMIFDHQGYNSEHAKHNRLMTVKRFLDYCYIQPFRIGSCFCIKVPRIVEILLNTVKFLVPRKIREKLILSSESGEKDIHLKISPEILPKWLGGQLSDEEAIDMEIFQRVLDKEEFYANYNEIY